MRTFLITGAGSDIGKACIECLRQDGQRCVALYSHNNDLGTLTDKCIIKIVKCDIGNIPILREHVRTLAQDIQIDGLISLAAVNERSEFATASLEQLEAHLRVNSLAPIAITQLLLPHMKERRWGRVLFGSSIGVKFGGGKESFAYSYSKHAGEFISSELRGLAAYNILCNSLRIGVTDTSRMLVLKKDLVARARVIPARRIARPREIGEYICWLVSEKNTYISGDVLSISGGE